MMSRIAFVVGLGILSFTAPAGAQKAPERQPALPDRQPAIPDGQPTLPDRQSESLDDSECPGVMRGVSLAVKERPGGVALTFTTPDKGHIEELQTMVGEAAAYLEFRSKMAHLHQESLEIVSTPVPALDIAVKKTPSGVVATIRTEDTSAAHALAAQARNLKEAWDNSECSTPGVDISRLQRVSQ